MEKQEVKTILKEYTDEVKRHNTILKEDFESKIKIIGEQYFSIQKKLEEHDQRFEKIDERFEKIENTLNIIKLDSEFIKNNLKRKVDLEEFEALERRVSLLETKVK